MNPVLHFMNDATEGVKLIPYAYAGCKQLVNMATFNKVNYKLRKRIVIDAENYVDCEFVNGLTRAYIYSGGLNFISGITDNIQVTGGQHNRFFPKDLDKEGTAWKLESKLCVPSGPDAGYSNAFRTIPTTYTGEMRFQAQLWSGVNKNKFKFVSTYSKSHGVYTDQLNGKWLVEISKDGGLLIKKAKYKTLAAGGTTNTNVVYPINYLLIDNEFKYTEADIYHPIDNPTGTVFRLLTAAQLDNFYTINAALTENNNSLTFNMMGDLGWAFSYNGHEIQHISMYKIKTNVWSDGSLASYAPSANFLNCSRYKVLISEVLTVDPETQQNIFTFTGSINKEEENQFYEITDVGCMPFMFKPYNATMNESIGYNLIRRRHMPSYFYSRSHFHDGNQYLKLDTYYTPLAHIVDPNRDINLDGSGVPIDFDYNFSVPFGSDIDFQIKACPIFVYYNSNNQEQIIRYQYFTYQHFDQVNGTNECLSFPPTNPSNFIGTPDYIKVKSGFFPSYLGSDVAVTMTLDGYTTLNGEFLHYNKVFLDNNPDGTNNEVIVNTGAPIVKFGVTFATTRYRWYPAYKTYYEYNKLLFSFFEREGYIKYQNSYCGQRKQIFGTNLFYYDSYIDNFVYTETVTSTQVKSTHQQFDLAASPAYELTDSVKYFNQNSPTFFNNYVKTHYLKYAVNEANDNLYELQSAVNANYVYGRNWNDTFSLKYWHNYNVFHNIDIDENYIGNFIFQDKPYGYLISQFAPGNKYINDNDERSKISDWNNYRFDNKYPYYDLVNIYDKIENTGLPVSYTGTP